MTRLDADQGRVGPGGRRGPGWWLVGLVLLVALALGGGWRLAQRPGGGRLGAVPTLAPAGDGDSGLTAAPAPAGTVATELPEAAPPAGEGGDGVAMLSVQVLAEFPHDPEAFTQGLVWSAGRLFESTGLEGRSSLREVALATGEVLRMRDLPPEVFGEGLALVDERLIQLTWKHGVAYEWHRDTFDSLGQFSYQGEGWGLCLDEGGGRLVMSDGSDRLTFRDPVSFEAQGQLAVTLRGQPALSLNELECVSGEVYANVWLTDWIYRIDLATGRVNAVIDGAGLLDEAQAPAADVLNGIAYRPETDTFLITGKLWPLLFEVRFVQATVALPFALRQVRSGLP